MLFIIAELHFKKMISTQQKLALKYSVFTSEPTLVEFCNANLILIAPQEHLLSQLDLNEQAANSESPGSLHFQELLASFAHEYCNGND
jgi:hypothetical protein